MRSAVDTNLLAYIGGIIDGEGHIGFHKSCRTRKTNKNPFYSVRVNVEMCDREIPELLQKTFGGSVQCRKRRNPLHKDCYDWVISSKETITFLHTILPYLHIVRKITTTMLCLEAQEHITKFNVKYTQLSKEEIDYRESIYQKCKLLNKRGN